MDALIHGPCAGVWGCLLEPKVFSAVGLEHGAMRVRNEPSKIRLFRPVPAELTGQHDT